jgi:hypothetical protein
MTDDALVSVLRLSTNLTALVAANRIEQMTRTCGRLRAENERLDQLWSQAVNLYPDLDRLTRKPRAPRGTR